MTDAFLRFAKAVDLDSIHYDIAPLRYCNPRKKGRLEERTLNEMGFPYDVNEMSHYYNADSSGEFYVKTQRHWQRRLPPFENRYVQYLLLTDSRDEAFARYFEEAEPYGVSKEETEHFLRRLGVYQLEPENALEVVREFIFIILEYAPKSFDYFTRCYGLKNAWQYSELYRTAYEILQVKIKNFDPSPRILQREVLKGTPLLAIYRYQFDNKSAIRDAVNALSIEALDRSPVPYYRRKAELLLLSLRNTDYTVNETRGGTVFPFCVYGEEGFLFALMCDDTTVTDDAFPDEFDAQMALIEAYDKRMLQQGIPVYHVNDFSLDEFTNEVSDDIRKSVTDIGYLYEMIQNGEQYRYLKAYYAQFDEE